MKQVQTFCQCIDKLLVLRRIFTQINLSLTVTQIIVVLTLIQEVSVGLVIMLVDNGHTQFVCQLPTVLQVGIAGMRARTGCTYNHDFGMLSLHLIINIGKAFAEFRRDSLLVAQTQVFQVEGCGVSGIGTHLSPLTGSRITVGPFYQVERLVGPFIHLAHRNHILRLVLHAPTAVGTLTAYATRQNRQRLHTQVFAELEIFIVPQSHALMVAPAILKATALFLRSDGCLPAVCIPEAVTASMNHATAGEAHELRVKVGQRLCQILAQSVSLVSILGHKRDLVHIHGTCGLG